MQQRRRFVAPRPLWTKRIFAVVHVVSVLGLAVLFPLGQGVATFAQVFLVLAILAVVLNVVEKALPGRIFPRPTGAVVGDDGVWTTRELVPWSDIRQVRRVKPMRTASERPV